MPSCAWASPSAFSKLSRMKCLLRRVWKRRLRTAQSDAIPQEGPFGGNGSGRGSCRYPPTAVKATHWGARIRMPEESLLEQSEKELQEHPGTELRSSMAFHPLAFQPSRGFSSTCLLGTPLSCPSASLELLLKRCSRRVGSNENWRDGNYGPHARVCQQSVWSACRKDCIWAHLSIISAR